MSLMEAVEAVAERVVVGESAGFDALDEQLLDQLVGQAREAGSSSPAGAGCRWRTRPGRDRVRAACGLSAHPGHRAGGGRAVAVRQVGEHLGLPVQVRECQSSATCPASSWSLRVTRTAWSIRRSWVTSNSVPL